ncbi:MAG: hypothetical protein LBT14_02885 [Treponema sp.]|jgi:hypothetical protein|nr:hypothetical protein [Treponema sp.]
MASWKPVLISILLSLGLGAGMFLVALRHIPQERNEKYAILTVDASYPDRFIGDALAAGIGKNYLSESTQWVFLDDFGALQRIPLDTYRDRVEAFDPRNDGYAERLRSFFIHNGKRRFFIPLVLDLGNTAHGKTTQTGAFEKSIAVVLGDIPFGIEYIGYERPLLLYCILFGLAAVVTLFLSEAPLVTVALLPVLAPFAFAGPLGLALAAALAALSGALTMPLRELFLSLRYGYHDIPVQWSWVSLLFLGGYGILCGIGGIPPAFGITGLVCFSGVLGITLSMESVRGNAHAHVRFTPVAIMEVPRTQPVFPRTIIPFALVSLQALFLPSMIDGINPYHVPEDLRDEALITAAEYEQHAAFQGSFSVSPLGRSGVSRPGTRYHVGEDGLIADIGAYDQTTSPIYDYTNDDDTFYRKNQEIPPFPLESLMELLGDSGHTYTWNATWIKTTDTPELIPVGLVLGFCIPAIFRRKQRYGKKKKMLVYNDKRIAA